MIHKYYEVTCDHCGGAEQFNARNMMDATDQARQLGWLVVKTHLAGNLRCFDALSCLDLWKLNQENKR